MKTYIYFLVLLVLLAGCGSSRMFKTPEHEAYIMKLYNQRLENWPKPFDTVRIKGKFGLTHVIISGSENAEPLVLLHAMGVNSTMWLPTIDSLSRYFRCYAVDFIGDINKSRLYDNDNHPENGKDYSIWLEELLDSLLIKKANIVGASMGGWITMNCAIYIPDRINKIALLGPMGISSVSFKVMSRLMMLLMFPTEGRKKDMLDWTLGDNQKTRAYFTDYMNVAMDCQGFLATPWEISDENLAKIKSPVLLLLGEKDGPIGQSKEPEDRAKALIKDVKVVVITGAGHMMNHDEPELVNRLLLDFLIDKETINANLQVRP